MKTQSQSYRALQVDTHALESGRARASGYALALIGASLFSTKAIFIKLAYRSDPDLQALTLLAIRMGFAIPLYILIGIWAFRRQRSTADAPPLTFIHFGAAALLGLMGYYGASLLDFTGLQYITAQLERLILFTYPIFVIVLGALFFGKSMSRAGIFAIILAYGGLALVFVRGSIAAGSNVVLGVTLVAGAAFVFAVFQLLAPFSIKKIGASLFTCIAMISAGSGVMAHYVLHSLLVHGEKFSDITMQVWLFGIAIAVLGTLIPSFFINIALGRIGAQAVSVISMIGPLVTVVLAVSILHEPFGLYDGIGTLLTMTGIGFYTWNDRKARG